MEILNLTRYITAAQIKGILHWSNLGVQVVTKQYKLREHELIIGHNCQFSTNQNSFNYTFVSFLSNKEVSRRDTTPT